MGGFFLRVAIRIAMVQVGARSTTGSPSTRKLGKNAMCQPTSQVNTAQTTMSNAASNGEASPSKNAGNNPICSTSAATATALAMATRLIINPKINIAGDVEQVMSLATILTYTLNG